MWVLAATILGSSLAFIDGTVVNVALPALQTALDATATELQWVVEGYALFLAALLLVGGALGDLFGRRRVFLAGVVLFALSSIWCGLAANIHQLIWARCLQGVGAALLVPGSLALISSSFPEETRGQAIGTWSGFTAITTAVGPLLGGWLVEHASWRWVFFINLPIAAAVVVLSLVGVPESKAESAGERLDWNRLDWAGALLATAGLGAITFSLLEWTARGTLVHLLSGVGVLLLAGFGLVESRVRNPMLPLGLFRSRNFSGANLLTLFLYGALSGAFYYLPLNLIQVQGYSATAAGAALLPFIVVVSVLSHWSGGLVRRYGARLPLVAGPAIAGVGFALLTTTGLHHPYWETTLPAVLVLGGGMAISIPPLTTVVMSSVSQEYAGAASGVNNAVSRVAGLLSLAAFGIVVAHTFASELARRLAREHLPPAVEHNVLAQAGKLAAIQTVSGPARIAIERSFIAGYDRVLLAGAVLCWISAASAWLMLRPGQASETR